MKNLKVNPKLSNCLQVAFLLLLLKSPQTLFAFSDMNDSIAQEEVIKSLQKRLDSLELRFEKSEIEKNETKKSIFDWNRGLYANVSLDISNVSLVPTTASGYIFRKTKRDSTRILLCPQLRFGVFTMLEQDRRKDQAPFISAGLEKTKRVGDRATYCDGWFINLVPDYGETSSSFAVIGGEYSSSLHFYYNESSSIGIGGFVRISGILDNHTSWKSALKNSGYTLQYDPGLRLTFSYFFARHEPKSRSK